MVAVEVDGGIYYDLWFPGYCWADTRGLWRPPGLLSPPRTEDLHSLQWEALTRAAATLKAHEPESCQWQLFPGLHLGNAVNARNFPIVLSTCEKMSQLSLGFVKEILEKVF